MTTTKTTTTTISNHNRTQFDPAFYNIYDDDSEIYKDVGKLFNVFHFMNGGDHKLILVMYLKLSLNKNYFNFKTNLFLDYGQFTLSSVNNNNNRLKPQTQHQSQPQPQIQNQPQQDTYRIAAPLPQPTQRYQANTYVPEYNLKVL